jgi:cell wall-associated NlpC family hydrolase
MTIGCVRFFAAAVIALLLFAPPLVRVDESRISGSVAQPAGGDKSQVNFGSLIGLSIALAETDSAREITYTIAEGGANLRDGHSTESNVITTLNEGIVVREIKTHSSWRYVEVVETGDRGWVWQGLLIQIVFADGGSTEAPEAPSDPADSIEAPEEEGASETNSVEAVDASEPVVDIDTGADSSATGAEAESTDAQTIADSDNPPVEMTAEGGDAIDVKKPKDEGKSESEDTSEPDFEGAAAGATAGSDLIALITAESVNLRAEPSLRSKVLAQVDTGMKVYIIEESKPWYFVSVPKLAKKGWVFGDFVQPLDYVVVTGDDVNLREKPDMSSKALMKLAKGMRFVKKAWQNNFVLVAHPEKGITGWVHQRYVKVEERKTPPVFIVKGFSVNFRKDPSVISDVYSQLDTGTKVTVLGREEKWTLVKYRGQTGWMYSEYLVTEVDWNKAGGITGATRSLGADLISRALELRGTPYVWSGESIKGFDCSGFIYYLIGSATGATDLPRSAADMFEQLGVPVALEDLVAGDLVFFTTYKSGASHVGLYLGDGDFVHASSAEAEVVISNMSEGYYKEHFVGAKRVPKDLFR